MLLAIRRPRRTAWLSALFKCVRGEASGFFKRRYPFQHVGVLLSIVLDIGRFRFADRARHVMWGERENEGHWIVGLSAVAKAKEPAGFPTCSNKLQFALSIRHWTCRLGLLAERQSRRLVPRQTTAGVWAAKKISPVPSGASWQQETIGGKLLGDEIPPIRCEDCATDA